MSSGDKPASISTSGSSSFSDVIDETCVRLKEKHVQYSIRCIHEMEEKLSILENELNQFLHSNAGTPRCSGPSGRRADAANFPPGK